MRKQLVTLALAGTVGLTGAVLVGPAVASAATGSPSAGPVATRAAAIKDALAGLVRDDTITQQQADRVASTLAERLPARGHGGRGGVHLSPEDTAAAIGISVDELRTAREAGRTLTQIAAAEGVSKADLVTKLVAAARADLAEDVAAGRLTQAQADAVGATLTERITARVDDVRGPGRGPGGRHHHGDRDHDATPAPSGSAVPSPSPTA